MNDVLGLCKAIGIGLVVLLTILIFAVFLTGKEVNSNNLFPMRHLNYVEECKEFQETCKNIQLR